MGVRVLRWESVGVRECECDSVSESESICVCVLECEREEKRACVSVSVCPCVCNNQTKIIRKNQIKMTKWQRRNA